MSIPRLLLELGDGLLVDVEGPVGDREIAARLAARPWRPDTVLASTRRRESPPHAGERDRSGDDVEAARAVWRSPSSRRPDCAPNQVFSAGLRIRGLEVLGRALQAVREAGRRASRGTSVPPVVGRCFRVSRRARPSASSQASLHSRQTASSSGSSRGLLKQRVLGDGAPALVAELGHQQVGELVDELAARAGACRAPTSRCSLSVSISSRAKCSSASRSISWREAKQ